MKKGSIVTMLSLGMFLSANAPSSSNTSSLDSVQAYQDVQENYFLKTDSASYHPFEAKSLKEKGVDYQLVRADTVDHSKIPSNSNYLSLREVRQTIDSLYKQSWAPKVITPDFYERFILKESSLNGNAYNFGSGASGLAQVRKNAWEEVMPLENFILNRFEPVKNLEAGIRYVSWLEKSLPKMNPSWDRLDDEEKREQIIASYNWGIGNLRANGWDFSSSPKETKNYKKFVENKRRNI